MTNILTKLKRVCFQIRGLFPETVPVGMTEYGNWVSSIIANYTLPTNDYDSVAFTFAAIVMRLGPTESSKPKYFFVKSFRAGAAKQVAGAVFYDIKSRQQAAEKAAAEASAPNAAAIQS